MEGNAEGRTGSGGGISGSATFCRLGRLEDETLDSSGSRAGLGSRAGNLRFFDGAGVRLAIAGVDAGAETEEAPAEVVDSEELAACLAAARVILLEGGMST